MKKNIRLMGLFALMFVIQLSDCPRTYLYARGDLVAGDLCAALIAQGDYKLGVCPFLIIATRKAI